MPEKVCLATFLRQIDTLRVELSDNMDSHSAARENVRYTCKASTIG